MPDTPTPTPALTDEQIDKFMADLRSNYVDAYWDFARHDGGTYFDALLAAVVARSKREERERIERHQVLHVWGFLSGRDDLVADVQVALCPGELHEVANHIINDASEHGYDVKSWTVCSLDGYLREVHAVWAVDPDMPMWHRFVTPSTPWVKGATQ